MNILLVGGPGTFTNKIIQKLRKEGHRIYLLTGSKYNDAKYDRVFERYDFPYDSVNVRSVFESVDPDAIICLGAYDSNFRFETDGNAPVSFIAGMTNILLCYAAQAKPGRLLYLSSEKVYGQIHSNNIDEDEPCDGTDTASITLAQVENSCRQWAQNAGLDIKVLRIDHLATIPADYSQVDELCTRMTVEALEKQRITCSPNAKLSMLSDRDAIEYIYTLLKSPASKQTVYNLSSGEEITEGDIAVLVFNELGMEKLLVSAADDAAERRVLSNKRYDSEFGQRTFDTTEQVVHNIVQYMKAHSEKFINHGEGAIPWYKKVYSRLGSFIRIMIPYIENMICFIPFFMLNNRAVGSQYFAKLDFYLLYVLLFAIIHGQTQAVFSCVMAVAGYVFRQMYTRTGFEVAMDYNTYVWIAQLFIIGLTVGHMHDQNTQLKEEAEENNDYMSRQIVDIEEINATNIRVKNTLESQLINQEDSFGKLYSITEQLDQYLPEEVMFYAVEMLSKLMECPDISLYIVSNADYARLFTATSANARLLGSSIRYREYTDVWAALEKHRVFINKKIESGIPSMAAGIFESERLQMIVMLWNVPWKNMTLGKANTLAVACSLIQRSSARAARHLETLKDEQHIENTMILSNDAFRSIYTAYNKAKSRGLTEYVLLHAETRGEPMQLIEQYGVKMASLIRQTDYIGMTDGGQLYVMLPNTTQESAGIVIRRFGDKGIVCHITEQIS